LRQSNSTRMGGTRKAADVTRPFAVKSPHTARTPQIPQNSKWPVYVRLTRLTTGDGVAALELFGAIDSCIIG
jgi:hypothetical protein